MTARAGMATLISDLRQKSNAGTADYTLAGVAYWTDTQLQTELDKQQQQWFHERLDSQPVLIDGTYTYYDYCVPDYMLGGLEENAAASGWCVRDSAGGSVNASSYSVNYQARRVTFSANQQGSVYYLDARTYNVNAAAAAVWRMKASAVASNVDWQSDNHRVSSSQEAANCLRMADYYDQQAGARVGRFVRSDEV